MLILRGHLYLEQARKAMTRKWDQPTEDEE